MGTTSSQPARSVPVRLPETFGSAALKVGLASDGIGLGDVAWTALVAFYGSVKAIGIELNVDPSLVRREIRSADFRRLQALDKHDAIAAISQAIGKELGTLPTLGAHVESLLEQRDRINRELDQLTRQGAAALERIA